MPDTTRKIVFVSRGSFPPAHYRSMIESFKAAIERPHFKGVGGQECYAAQVEIVDSVEDAEALVKAGGIYSVVFVSGDVANEAEHFQKAHPHTYVFCLYGDVFQGRVTYLDKLWLSVPGTLKKIFAGQ